MSERGKGPGFNPLFESIESILHSLRSKAVLARFAINYARHNLRYRSKVDKETDQKAAEHLTTFTGEMLAFLKQNPSSILSPLNPTSDEIKSVLLLLNSVGNNTLEPVSMRGRISPSGAPYLAHTYLANEMTKTDARLMGPKIRTGLATLWDIESDKLIRLSIDCHKGLFLTGYFDFIALKKKAESPDDVVDVLGERITGAKTQIRVYLDGGRIDREMAFILEGQNFEKVDQYYLLGCFDGEASKKTYWIYGSNSINSREKVTSKEGVGVLETVVSS